MDFKNSQVPGRNIQKTNKESNGKAIFLEILQLTGHLALFLVKLIYFIFESLYYKINPQPPKSVKGEIVLITGTGHGIGKELALAYAAQGAVVVGVDINSKSNAETVQQIANNGYPKAFSYVCDISKRDDVLETAAKIKQEVGEVTILVNNAGIMPTHPLLQHTPQEIEKIIGINLMAHFWLLEAFLPSMKRNNNGHIVSLSSVAGLMGSVNLVPYCASKFGVRGLMEALHEELRITNPKNRIKITNVCPFMVDTGLCKKPKIKFPKLMPLLSPKEVAEEIVNAQRREETEITLPRYLGGCFAFGRTLPLKAAMALVDMIDAYIDTDL